MKNACTIIIICLTCNIVHAQGFFNQKGAWIKNQIKQIALCQVYIKNIEKGYNIAKDGLNVIGNIKNGDFHLHLEHFNSLLEINPAINKYAHVLSMLVIQQRINKLYVKSNDDYVNAVFMELIEQVQQDIDELNTLLSADNYSMTDDERIKNIDKLYAAMKDKYAFAKSFSGELKLLTMQRLRETNEVRTSRLLNNVKLP